MLSAGDFRIESNQFDKCFSSNYFSFLPTTLSLSCWLAHSFLTPLLTNHMHGIPHSRNYSEHRLIPRNHHFHIFPYQKVFGLRLMNDPVISHGIRSSWIIGGHKGRARRAFPYVDRSPPPNHLCCAARVWNDSSLNIVIASHLHLLTVRKSHKFPKA